MARGTTQRSSANKIANEIDALLREAKLTAHSDLPLAGEGEYDTKRGWARRVGLKSAAFDKVLALLVSRGEAETGIPGVEIRHGYKYRVPAGLVRSKTLMRLANK